MREQRLRPGDLGATLERLYCEAHGVCDRCGEPGPSVITALWCFYHATCYAAICREVAAHGYDRERRLARAEGRQPARPPVTP